MNLQVIYPYEKGEYKKMLFEQFFSGSDFRKDDVDAVIDKIFDNIENIMPQLDIDNPSSWEDVNILLANQEIFLNYTERRDNDKLLKNDIRDRKIDNLNIDNGNIDDEEFNNFASLFADMTRECIIGFSDTAYENIIFQSHKRKREEDLQESDRHKRPKKTVTFPSGDNIKTVIQRGNIANDFGSGKSEQGLKDVDLGRQ